MRGRIARALVPLAQALLAGLVLLQAAGRTRAEWLLHDYQLRGSLADALGGPALVADGGTLAATGYTFGAGQGLTLSGAFPHPDSYAIEVVFHFDNVLGFRKIIDTKDLTKDEQLYDFNGRLSFFPNVIGPAPVLADGADARVILSRDGATDTLTGYVNGVSQFSFTDLVGRGVFTGPDNIIHLFEDDANSGGSEVSSGHVREIRVYDGPLSGAEAAALSGPNVLSPEPSALALIVSGAVCLTGTVWLRRRRSA
jgi:hypothetical protein